MTAPLTPHPFQQHDIDGFLNEPTYGGLNATGVGGGKTLVGTEISRHLQADNVVIVAPVNTFDGWERHMQLQRDMPTMRVGGSTAAQKDAHLRMIQGEKGAFFMSWEFMRSMDWDDMHPDFVIMDEVHRAQNRKSQQALAYHSLAKGVFGNPEGRIIGLSGTPAGNHMTGLWSVARGLWPEAHVSPKQTYNGQPGQGLAYWPWCDKWFKKEWNDYAGYSIPTVEHVPGELVKALPYYVRHEQGVNCCDFHPKGMQEDLQQVNEQEVFVDLGPEQRKLYKQMEQDMVAWMDDHDWPITTGSLPIVQHMRLLQIALGTPTADMIHEMTADGELSSKVKVTFPLDTKSSKINAILDLIGDNLAAHEPLIIWTHSTALIPAIVARINANCKDAVYGQQHTAVEWSGNTSHAKRARIKAEFGHGGPNIIVAQIAALAEGVDGLQFVCHNEIIVSESADNMQNEQSLGRLDRPGQEMQVNRWYIRARKTIEEGKTARLSLKGSRLKNGLRAR